MELTKLLVFDDELVVLAFGFYGLVFAGGYHCAEEAGVVGAQVLGCLEDLLLVLGEDAQPETAVVLFYVVREDLVEAVVQNYYLSLVFCSFLLSDHQITRMWISMQKSIHKDHPIQKFRDSRS